MEVQDPERRRPVNPNRFHRRFVLLALIAGVAAAVAAGLAFAKTRSTPVGTGVVVIDTKLAYEHGRAAGTGMVLTSSGEVLTNNHVIRGATSIRIVVPRTGRSYTAKVIGYDVSDDVALLQARAASNLKTVSLGSSAPVKVGQSVKAVGNAGGTGSLVSASGIVTGLRRTIAVSDDQGGSESLAGLIETNAALRAGDSGGPLLNAAGKVVGMDTAASAAGGFQQSASTDGYAIPIDRALTIAKRIKTGKGSTSIHMGSTAFLGVEVMPLQEAGPYAGGSGAVIAGVFAGGPASAAGLVAGDTITVFGGRVVSSPSALPALLLTKKPGARVAVTYVDATGAGHSTTVTLASGPPQ